MTESAKSTSVVSSRPVSRRASIAVLATCIAVLAGCASVPTSGPVRFSDEVAAADREGAPVALVSPPADGATPAEVVTGFLTANAVPDDNYAVARTFLSPEVQESWNPESGAIVYSDGAGFELEGAATAEVGVTANEVGRISSTGAYQVSTPGTTLEQQFVLRQISGQWRILELRDGLLLTERDIARVYDGYALYFLDPSRTVVVPDRVLVARDRPGTATTLVRRLLNGPTAWLAPAVVTAFPTGTALAIDAVPVDNGVVTVELNNAVLEADEETRRALGAQLTWTLSAVPGVRAVQVTVGGQPLAIEGAGTILVRESFVSFDPDVLADGTSGYLIEGGRLRSVVGDREPVAGDFGEGAIEPVIAGVAVTNDRAAAEPSGPALEGQVYIAAFNQDEAPRRRATLSSVAALSFDVTGTLFVTDEQANGVVALPQNAGSVQVSFTVNGRVRHAELSRDGTRVALIVRRTDAASDTLYVARVVRRPGLVRFEEPRRVENQLTDVVDVAWSDADRVAVVAATTRGTRQVFDVVVGGTSVVQRGGVAGLSGVAAAPGSPLLVEADGGVWENAGSGWRRIGPGRNPVYPG